MRITSVSAHRVRIPFKAVFTHALQSRRETEPIILVIASETGEIGVGEVLPRPYLTGETVESVSQKEIPALVQRWLGREFQDRDEVVEALHRDLEFVGRALATFAGWELALLDLAGKTFHFSAGDVLGQDTRTILESGVVIDFCVPTACLEKYCMLLRLAGKRHVKVKVGLNEDLRRLAIVQEVFGNDHPLRLDANAAWTPDQAIESLRQMRRFNLCSVEQPVPAGDLAGMRKVREQTGISLVADESLCSLDDAKSLAAGGAADVFNIRIGKCGGLLASKQLVEFAHDAGLSCQLGTLVGETGILSQAAEMFGRRVEGFAFLEGKGQNKTLLLQDVVEVLPPGNNADGLGIMLATSCLEHWAASPPTFFNELQRSIA